MMCTLLNQIRPSYSGPKLFLLTQSLIEQKTENIPETANEPVKTDRENDDNPPYVPNVNR